MLILSILLHTNNRHTGLAAIAWLRHLQNILSLQKLMHKILLSHFIRIKVATVTACVALASTASSDVLIESEKLLPTFIHPPLQFSAGTKYDAEARKYQGIPTIERTANGRLWAAWYAGPIWEDKYTYVVVSTSDDDGETWGDISLVIDPDGDGPLRASDPCFWIDPNGKLWLFWWLAGRMNDRSQTITMAITTDNPDDAQPDWSEPKTLFPGVMMNKPIVNRNGEWLMPTAVWHQDDSSRLIVSKDHGKTWFKRGTASVPSHRRDSDEPMIIERKDGSLLQLIRTKGFGISRSISTDGGKSWTEAEDYLPDATSRFFIGRLPSGNLLLIKHGPLDKRISRSHLTAYLSDDDGESWKGGLVLDERDSVSYPDASFSPDGYIYTIHDWKRADDKHILMSKFTEKDILKKDFVSSKSRKKVLVNQATGINDKSWMKPKADK